MGTQSILTAHCCCFCWLLLVFFPRSCRSPAKESARVGIRLQGRNAPEGGLGGRWEVEWRGREIRQIEERKSLRERGSQSKTFPKITHP